MYCMMLLEGGKIQCVALLFGPVNVRRRLIYEEPFRVIIIKEEVVIRKIRNQCKTRILLF